jgi:hypothetical protein
VRWVGDDGYGDTTMWVTRLRHLGEEWLTEMALGDGGGSTEGVTGARPEEWRVEPVVGLVGTGVSWWSSRTERWLAAMAYGGRRGERRPLEHMAGVRQLTAWMRRSEASGGMETIGGARTSPVGMSGPLKVRGFIEFGQRVPRTLQQAGLGAGFGATNRWAAGMNFPLANNYQNRNIPEKNS